MLCTWLCRGEFCTGVCRIHTDTLCPIFDPPLSRFFFKYSRLVLSVRVAVDSKCFVLKIKTCLQSQKAFLYIRRPFTLKRAGSDANCRSGLKCELCLWVCLSSCNNQSHTKLSECSLSPSVESKFICLTGAGH